MMRKNSGVTLIELLIVIAIMSIFAGMVMTAIVAPMKDREVSEQTMEFEAGAGKFFSQFLRDVRTASSIDTTTSGVIALTSSTLNGETVSYTIEPAEGRNLLQRRVGEKSPAILLAKMQSLELLPTENGNLWTLRISQKPGRFQSKPADFVREMKFHQTDQQKAEGARQ